MNPDLTRRELFQYLYNRQWQLHEHPPQQKQPQQSVVHHPSEAKRNQKKQCFSISEILDMPDETFHSIQPVFNKNEKVLEHLLDTMSESMQAYLTEAKIVDMFNGQHTLKEIACQLKDENDSISIEEAYLAVKGLFVRLCEKKKVGFHRKVGPTISI